MPVIIVRGPIQHPVAVVTANLHGDECTGLGVVRALDAYLREHPPKGTVVMYPSCNPQGLLHQTRHVPADEVDLNRVFPGAARGSQSSRLAHALWRDILRREPDVVIDLHADSPSAIPYAIVDRPVRLNRRDREAMGARLLRLADASGFTVLREYPDDIYVQFGLDRSLAGTVVNVGRIPAVTLEVGPRRYLDADAVQVSLKATLGILSEMGITDAPASHHPTRVAGSVARRVPYRRAGCSRRW